MGHPTDRERVGAGLAAATSFATDVGSAGGVAALRR
jgi:hypothetical protein